MHCCGVASTFLINARLVSLVMDTKLGSTLDGWLFLVVALDHFRVRQWAELILVYPERQHIEHNWYYMYFTTKT